MFANFHYWRFRLLSTLRWYLAARTRYDVHSPFLADFVAKTFTDRRYFHAFGLVRALRRFWRQQRGEVNLMQLGAPSKTARSDRRSISGLVKDNAIGDRSGRFLFRTALWLRPDRIIEFGSNAGISTIYLHAADTRTPLDTVEGNPQVAELAKRTYQKAGASPHLRAHVATFEDWLTDFSLAACATDLPRRAGRQATPKRLLFFLDGDHRYQPTLDYVAALLPHATEESIFIIADIHWSEGMERAWEALKQHPKVTASLDTYHFGLLFFRPELNGPHLALIPTWWKPWRVGFFN